MPEEAPVTRAVPGRRAAAPGDSRVPPENRAGVRVPEAPAVPAREGAWGMG